MTGDSNEAANEIRLLTLMPGNPGQRISYNLTIKSFKELPNYEALSYVLGNPKITQPVQLCGAVHPVTVNLESALPHLRYPDKERTLRIDALCI
jgi:hypothetical protein